MQPEVLKILMDDDFLIEIENDPVIKKLECSKFSRQEEFFALTTLLNKDTFINGLKVQPITPLIWCFLWLIESPFVVYNKEIQQSDIDLFLYVLTRGVESDSIAVMVDESKDYCIKNNMDYDDVKNDLEMMIRTAFKPLEVIPMSNDTENIEVVYNVAWAFDLASVVIKETNYFYTVEQVIKTIPLTTCYYFYINNLKKIDSKGILKTRSNLEIEGEIYKRTLELAKEYYHKNYKD